MSVHKNIGNFSVDERCMKYDRDELHEVFATLRFIPLDVKYDHINRVYEYTGISPLFTEPCKEGTQVPQYNIIIHTVDERISKIEAKHVPFASLVPDWLKELNLGLKS